MHCDVRIVLLHYAPVEATGDAASLPGSTCCSAATGSRRPLAECGADLVLHGHAHAGSFKATIGSIPVYNVAVHVTGRDFWIFDLEGACGRSEVEVEGPA